jgi:hypothetical protein
MPITLRRCHGTTIITLLLVVVVAIEEVEVEVHRPLLATIKRADSMYHHHLIKVSSSSIISIRVHRTTTTVVVSLKMSLSNWIIYQWRT